MFGGVLGKCAGCALTTKLPQKMAPGICAVCPNTLVDASSILHADGFRCYAPLNLVLESEVAIASVRWDVVAENHESLPHD